MHRESAFVSVLWSLLIGGATFFFGRLVTEWTPWIDGLLAIACAVAAYLVLKRKHTNQEVVLLEDTDANYRRDVGVFVSLLPTVEAIQEFRDQVAVYGHSLIDPLKHMAVQRQLAELIGRLGDLGVHPARLSPSGGELDESLALLSAYMKNRNLKRAREHFRTEPPAAGRSSGR